MKRVKGVTVTPHYCPIQDKDNAWYKQFQVIVMGLDSIEARRWLNAMACSLVEFEENESGVRKPDLGCARHRRACSPVGGGRWVVVGGRWAVGGGWWVVGGGWWVRPRRAPVRAGWSSRWPG